MASNESYTIKVGRTTVFVKPHEGDAAVAWLKSGAHSETAKWEPKAILAAAKKIAAKAEADIADRVKREEAAQGARALAHAANKKDGK